MELYRQITVDLYNPYPLYVMNAKQGDTARGALITLTADGNIIELTAEKVRVYAKKKDGTKLYNDCTVENGKIKVKFTNQLLAIPGELPVELEMIQVIQRLTRLNLIQIRATN